MNSPQKNSLNAIQAAIFIGSQSDADLVRPCADLLQSLDIPHRFTISSAHRSPERTEQLVRELEQQGCQVYICAAGMAAHLAGAVAARTCKPVIGIPISASALNGLDALLATVMMPPGFPVATVALDAAGAKNAAWLAAQILALQNKPLAEKLLKARADLARDVQTQADALEKNLS